ncbi:MAG TPA: diphosphomevalonate decarboxylase [Flavobacteriales bacterium]|nr:diphosphomevalonate decarboxylase [Flavobacteriales bacterium]
MELLEQIKSANISIAEGSTSWSSPSNIAMIKYWGKYSGQLPANPSMSFTLDHCKTETRVDFRKGNGNGVSLEFLFEGKANAAFEQRILKYLNSISTVLPMLEKLHLSISSSNSFPHSSGIASSASSMSALALNLVSIFNELAEEKLEQNEFLQFASFLARLASGSACRSIYGGFTVWGESDYFYGSSDLYAVPINSEYISPIFNDLCDDVLIIEKGAKKVSSSAGHELMHDHPFAANRFDLAKSRMGEIREMMSLGDIEGFGKLIEKEALMLHGMMMTSDPYYILMKPNTLSVIEKIWEFRREKNIPVFFTLDAGANVHVIYPSEHTKVVSEYIRENLLVYCENASYLCDRMGTGPKNLNA